MKYLGTEALSVLTNAINGSLKSGKNNALMTENKEVLSAINEVNEKLRGYVENLRIAEAHLRDTDESILTTADGSPLVLENPIYRFDNSVSDIYRTVQNISSTEDYTQAVSAALSDSNEKEVYLSKGVFPMNCTTVFSSGNSYTIRGRGAEITQIKPLDTEKDFNISGKKHLVFEGIGFEGLKRIVLRNCTDVVFKNCSFNNFTDRGVMVQTCTGVKFLGCSFNEIGTEITNQNSSGQGINFMDSRDAVVEDCRFNETKAYSIMVYNSMDGFICRRNIFTNTVFGAIQLWRAVRKGERPIEISGNILMNIGFGTPAPNMPLNEYGQVTGVGCAAIYGGNTGSADTYDLSDAVVRDNVIIKCREVGIEGTWANVTGNLIYDCGAESGTGEGERYTPSRTGIHIVISQTYDVNVSGNTIITKTGNCIATTGGYADSRINIINNYLRNSAADNEAIHLFNTEIGIGSLKICGNTIDGYIMINNSGKEFGSLVIDNDTKYAQVFPVIFSKGRIRMNEVAAEPSIYFDKSGCLSVDENEGYITVKQFGYAEKELNLTGLCPGEDHTVWVKLKYRSEAAADKKAARIEVSGELDGYADLSGTGGAEKTVNVLLKPQQDSEGKIKLRVSNISAAYAGGSYKPLDIFWCGIRTFVKEE